MAGKPQMNFAEAVEGRRSVRRYRPDPVPRQDVERMIALDLEPRAQLVAIAPIGRPTGALEHLEEPPLDAALSFRRMTECTA